jgi:hypothetical protein
MGVYQIKQVPCYTNEHLTEDGLYELLLFKEAIGINFQFIVHCPYFFSKYFIQIYHVWEGYLRKIPVERRKISRAEWRGKFSLKTAWYISITSFGRIKQIHHVRF